MGEVLELWRVTGYVVDDQIRHQLMRFAEGPYVIPITEAGVDFCVICRVKTSIGSIDGVKKRK